MNNQEMEEAIKAIPIQDKIKGVTEVILESIDLPDIPSGMTMGFMLGILVSTTHPEWAIGIRAWLLSNSPEGWEGIGLTKLGNLYVNNIPLEKKD